MGRATKGVAGWMAASVALWGLCLPVAWVVVNGAHVVFTAADEFPVELGATLWSYVYGGVLPLVVTLVVLVYLARLRPAEFRPGAVALSLLLGSWFGFYLVGPDQPVVQSVLLAWTGFGLLVPRPPHRTTEASPD